MSDARTRWRARRHRQRIRRRLRVHDLVARGDERCRGRAAVADVARGVDLVLVEDAVAALVHADVDALAALGAVLAGGLVRGDDQGGRRHAAFADVGGGVDLIVVEDAVAALIDADVDALAPGLAVLARGLDADLDERGRRRRAVSIADVARGRDLLRGEHAVAIDVRADVDALPPRGAVGAGRLVRELDQGVEPRAAIAASERQEEGAVPSERASPATRLRPACNHPPRLPRQEQLEVPFAAVDAAIRTAGS